MNLKEYENDIYLGTMKKFLGHLWYLSKELIDFAFFNGNVFFETKSKTVHALKTKENDNFPLKRARIDSDVIHQTN